jgi:hypothetical protein
MKKNAITRSDLNHAIYVKNTVVPALEAVKKISLKTVDGDQVGFDQIQSFACLLEAFLVTANATIAQAANYDVPGLYETALLVGTTVVYP